MALGTAGLPEADRKKGADSLIEKITKYKKGGNWKRWILRIFFLIVACVSGAIIEAEKIYVPEIFTSTAGKIICSVLLSFTFCLWSVAVSFLVAGLQENGHGSKLSFLHNKCEGITSIEYAGEIKVVIIADDSLLVTTEGTEQQILGKLIKDNEGLNRIAEAIEQKEVDLSGL